jgi:hypothetical protein
MLRCAVVLAVALAVDSQIPAAAAVRVERAKASLQRAVQQLQGGTEFEYAFPHMWAGLQELFAAVETGGTVPEAWAMASDELWKLYNVPETQGQVKPITLVVYMSRTLQLSPALFNAYKPRLRQLVKELQGVRSGDDRSRARAMAEAMLGQASATAAVKAAALIGSDSEAFPPLAPADLMSVAPVSAAATSAAVEAVRALGDGDGDGGRGGDGNGDAETRTSSVFGDEDEDEDAGARDARIDAALAAGERALWPTRLSVLRLPRAIAGVAPALLAGGGLEFNRKLSLAAVAARAAYAEEEEEREGRALEASDINNGFFAEQQQLQFAMGGGRMRAEGTELFGEGAEEVGCKWARDSERASQ